MTAALRGVEGLPRVRAASSVVALSVAAWCALIGAGHASASVIDTNLNFSAVNQNLWGPGEAIVADRTISIPDPAVHVDNLSPGSFSDPTSAIAHFLGVDVGVKISPTASFSAGLTASYHVNTGSYDVNYPAAVRLRLPDQVVAGQPFTVSAEPPGPVALSANPVVSQTALAAIAGAGYSTSSLAYRSVVNEGLLAPVPGFATQFPYAEARVALDLAASGGVDARFCLVVVCPGKTFNFQTVDARQQIFEVNSLSGIQVLNQPVVSFNQTLNLAEGVSVTFRSPSINLDASLPSGASLAPLVASGQQDFLDFSFDANKLLPVVGALLQNNVGPIGYDLLSVSPTLSLGLSQSISFDPTEVFVNLQFSAPVLDSRDGLVKTEVLVPVDGSGVSLTPATVGGGLTGTLQVKPTYLLESTVHNTTALTLGGTVTVAALALDTPKLGPFYDHTFDLGTATLFDLIDDPWSSEIPAITTPTQSIPFQSSFLQKVAVNLGGYDGGGSFFDVYSSGTLIASHVYGDLVNVPVSGGAEAGCNFNDPDFLCDTLFQANQDIVIGSPLLQQIDLGRLLCIVCIDRPEDLYAPTSPFLTDAALNPLLYLSDLHSFPEFLTPAALLDPTNAHYDPQLAQSQFFQQITSTPSSIVDDTVPEPATLWLLAIAMFCALPRSRRGRATHEPGWSSRTRWRFNGRPLSRPAVVFPGAIVMLGAVVVAGVVDPAPARASAFVFDTGSTDLRIGTASGPVSGGLKVATESADDFITSSTTQIQSATFTGLLTGDATVRDLTFVGVEIYRVFPLDSTSPPSGNAPARTNSPSDATFDSRDSSAGTLAFTVADYGSTSVSNSVVSGINKVPGQTTGGEGEMTGSEVMFAVSFTTPFTLPADHYYFVPQVGLDQGMFLWLSAPKPIVAPGTPFTPDLESWIRNADLAPDWLRVGTDVVGGNPAPTFNAAFSLAGEAEAAVPEPGSFALLLIGAAAAFGGFASRCRGR